LAPLVALHASSDDGTPMREQNGWYWLAGCLDIGEQYHGGNGTPARGPDECLRIFAKHCRIGLDQADAILTQAKAARLPVIDLNIDKQREAVRDRWCEICETMRPRWTREAADAVEHFSLPVPTSTN
jgi:hypothetical protein